MTWLILKLKLCITELNLMTRSHFIEILMILTNYVFDVIVRLTEYSVTVESVTLRFYYTCLDLWSVSCFSLLSVGPLAVPFIYLGRT